jgi:hypothetical protein
MKGKAKISKNYFIFGCHKDNNISDKTQERADRYLKTEDLRNGAPDQNRTDTSSLEGYSSTIELQAHMV